MAQAASSSNDPIVTLAPPLRGGMTKVIYLIGPEDNVIELIELCGRGRAAPPSPKRMARCELRFLVSGPWAGPWRSIWLARATTLRSTT